MKQLTLLFAMITLTCAAQQPIWKGKQFTVYPDRVEQGNFVARATSNTSLESNYKSPVNEFVNAEIEFKFSINGKDNEMPVGMNHTFTCTENSCETPVISFGKQNSDHYAGMNYLKPSSKWKVRLDMRDVLKAFKTDGYYTTFNGNKIYKDDFKGVYIAGNTNPLIWDFDNLVNHKELELKDADGDGIYETTLMLNVPTEQRQTATNWKLGKDISAYPQYSSDQPLSNAIYNMSLEEMINAIEPDSTFRTGKEWAGVWTRDISYSIILSMAYLQPKVAMNSLLRKVNKKKKIIQDTGTGGAWPVSTDRMIWAWAAWEIYLATGDKDWLSQAYLIVKNSITDDEQTAYDPVSGLVKGESSFLDWREQTYPRWMEPVDIAESKCLGTNAVHFAANSAAAKMAMELKKDAESEHFRRNAEKIKKGINEYLWMPEKKYYAQYLYGRSASKVSPRSEALGEALCILLGIADAGRQKDIVSNVPLTDFGISCIYPQIPGIPPYHNNAVWPFVQTYWLWASAKAGNEQAVLQSIGSIYRPAAMFLTNKENFVADNGDFAGTQINSSNMLWSLSGNISIIHKVLFGIRFTEKGLRFEPFVPAVLAGNRTLSNFTYRNAILDIEMQGSGNRIKQIMLDDSLITDAIIPQNLKGRHQVKIILADESLATQAINQVANYTTLPSPDVDYEPGEIKWKPVAGATKYNIYRNGNLVQSTSNNRFPAQGNEYYEFQISAVDANGVESFLSAPNVLLNNRIIQTYQIEEFASKSSYSYKGFNGTGFSEISTSKNAIIRIPVIVEADGEYLISFRYANGNGPTNTENKCAVRTLLADQKKAGTVLFPQRGKGEWSNWGMSNIIRLRLSKGSHILSLKYEASNENMNGEVNQAMLDEVRLIQVR